MLKCPKTTNDDKTAFTLKRILTVLDSADAMTTLEHGSAL